MAKRKHICLIRIQRTHEANEDRTPANPSLMHSAVQKDINYDTTTPRMYKENVRFDVDNLCARHATYIQDKSKWLIS
ncbi:hypothetical protein DPMN_109954 [Dreissena polymorpha]|uniref:Uncharacterized protein n=1 Tax=Dreissena polymorpha TaxID=45954 RepID=A0A9D4QNF7_DREPO|nr:hypothetical protein DPMN_109954 [Dreissena polymorpha]